MGCFSICLSKFDAYIRMRDYLRGKMEKRKEKKRQKELERLKREVGSAKDVAENSADVTSPVTTRGRSNINRSPRNVDSSRSSGSNHSSRSQGNVGDINSGSSDKVSGGESEDFGSSESSGGGPIPVSGGGNFCKKASSDSDGDVDLTSFIQSSRDNTVIQVEEADEEDIFTTNLRLRKIVSTPCDVQRSSETPEEVRKRQFLRGTASLLTAVTENHLPVIEEESIYVSKVDFVMPACKISITEQRRQRDLKDGFGVFESKP